MQDCRRKEKIGVNILKKYKGKTKVQQIPAKKDTDDGRRQLSLKSVTLFQRGSSSAVPERCQWPCSLISQTYGGTEEDKTPLRATREVLSSGRTSFPLGHLEGASGIKSFRRHAMIWRQCGRRSGVAERKMHFWLQLTQTWNWLTSTFNPLKGCLVSNTLFTHFMQKDRISLKMFWISLIQIFSLLTDLIPLLVMFTCLQFF